MEKPANVFVFDTPEQLAVAAAERFVECQRPFHGEIDLLSVVLAGGNTPKRVYELLATDRFKKRIAWPQVNLFFGDERCVPPDHPDSNYSMAYGALISRVQIPAQNVHRIIGEANPVESASRYESQLRIFFAGAPWPRFNLVFLGMGEDGHTASLFPGSEALKEESKWVIATRPREAPHERITLTIPALNHAARIMFLVTGAGKAARLAQVLRSRGESEPLPAQAIKPVAGTVEWLVDSAAASLL